MRNPKMKITSLRENTAESSNDIFVPTILEKKYGIFVLGWVFFLQTNFAVVTFLTTFFLHHSKTIVVFSSNLKNIYFICDNFFFEFIGVYRLLIWSVWGN